MEKETTSSKNFNNKQGTDINTYQNKNTFIKNILEHFYKFGYLPRGYTNYTIQMAYMDKQSTTELKLQRVFF